jgi:hypothetical protein
MKHAALNMLSVFAVVLLALSTVTAGRAAGLAAKDARLPQLDQVCTSLKVSAKTTDLGAADNFYAFLAEACTQAMWRSVAEDDPASKVAENYIAKLAEMHEIVDGLNQDRMVDLFLGSSLSAPVNDVAVYLIAKEVGVFSAYGRFYRATQSASNQG